MVSHARQIGTFLLCRHFRTFLGMASLASVQEKGVKRGPSQMGWFQKDWRITGLDLYYLTMGKIAKLKPQVDGLSKIENCRYGWGSPNQPRNPA